MRAAVISDYLLKDYLFQGTGANWLLRPKLPQGRRAPSLGELGYFPFPPASEGREMQHREISKYFCQQALFPETSIIL